MGKNNRENSGMKSSDQCAKFLTSEEEKGGVAATNGMKGDIVELTADTGTNAPEADVGNINYLIPYLQDLVQDIKGKPCRESALRLQEDQIDICRFAYAVATRVRFTSISEQYKNLAKELADNLWDNQPFFDTWFKDMAKYFVSLIGQTEREADYYQMYSAFNKILNTGYDSSGEKPMEGGEVLGLIERILLSDEAEHFFRDKTVAVEDLRRYREEIEIQFNRLDQLLFFGCVRRWSAKYEIEIETMEKLCEEILEIIQRDYLKQKSVSSEQIRNGDLLTPFLGACVC